MRRCLQGYRLAQMGPNTLRNTCISQWLSQGVPLGEILRRCGLKDAGRAAPAAKHLNPVVTL